MKKSTISILAIAALAFFSCKKEDTVVTNSNPKPIDNQVSKTKIVSNWMTMTFAQGVKYNPSGLEGTEHFNPSTTYDQNQTTKIVFARTTDGYKALPAEMFVDGAQLQVSYLLGLASFTVMVNDASGGIPATSAMDNCQFRYIVVSNAILNGLDVDLSDYSSVARALNIED